MKIFEFQFTSEGDGADDLTVLITTYDADNNVISNGVSPTGSISGGNYFYHEEDDTAVKAKAVTADDVDLKTLWCFPSLVVVFQLPGAIQTTESNITSAVQSAESSIRGADNDTLKTISDHLDTFSPSGAPFTIITAEVNQNGIKTTDNLKDFYEETTLDFAIEITSNGVAVDISNDSVKLLIKKKRTDLDEDAVLDREADSKTTLGAATFNLTPDETEITPGTYYLEIDWVTSDNNKYVLLKKTIRILDKLRDVE